MKRFILITASFFVACSCIAQSNAPYVYADIGVGKGTFTSYKMGVNWFFHDHHSVGIYYHRHWRDALQVPSDYSLSGIFGSGKPNDKMIFGSVTYGRIIPMTDIARINLKGGALVGVYRYPAHFRPKNGNSSFVVLSSSNYTYSTDEELLPGVLVNPVAEFSFSRSLGMTLGATGMFSNIQSFFSIDITFIAGSLREPVKDANYE